MRMVWRASNGLMFAVFMVAVVVQYNDPDPLLWMLVYGAAAGVSLATVIGRPLHRLVPAATAAFAMTWALVLFPRFFGKVSPGDMFAEWKMSVLGGPLEEAREATGLGIVAFWMTVSAVVQRLGVSRAATRPVDRTP